MGLRLSPLPSTSLAKLLEIGRTDTPVWSLADQSELLGQLLDLPLDRAFPSIIGNDSADGKAFNPASNSTSLRHLLEDPQPALARLVAIKEYVNSSNESPDQALPREVATAIYFTCIARALVVCGQTITSLDRSQLDKGLRWVHVQQWVDAGMKKTVEAALRCLDDPNSGGTRFL